MYIPLQTSKGYNNWKDATLAFRKHQESKTHQVANEAVITFIPKTTGNIGELLSKAHKEKRSRKCSQVDKDILAQYMIYYYQELTDNLDLKEIRNDFISANESHTNEI